MNHSRSIRARIHDSALKRVTRTFAATLADIFAETLQNARRAGATRVRVTLTGDEKIGPLQITVTDDGVGIADPAVLLSFGENGWNEKLVRREDAAGMGFLSLARRGCAVSSRPRARDGSPAPGWRVELSPAHFLGEDDATIQPTETAPFPHGTAVTFPAAESETANTVRLALEAAARHYPLPVIFEHPPHTPSEGVQLERRAFLDGAVHVEKWRGLAFGVFKNLRQRFGLKAPDFNFHGLTVPVRLPEVGTAGGAHWIVAADIEDCPELEFVLPARKEAVETPFLADMRDAARLAIYRALAADDDPARHSRISSGPVSPASTSRRRRPSCAPGSAALADLDHWREPQKPNAIGTDALIVACDPEPPEAQAFARAAESGGLASRLFAPDPRLEGYDWYDAIARITGIHTYVTTHGQTHALEDYDVPARTGAPEAPLAQRPEVDSASAQPSRRPGNRIAPSICRRTSPSRARPGPGSATHCLWSPPTARWSRTNSRASCTTRTSRPRTMPTPIPGTASAPISTPRPCTSPPACSYPTTRRGAARSPTPCSASSSGSSRAIAARTSPYAASPSP